MAKHFPLLKYENIPCFWGFVNTLYYVSHLKQYVRSNKSKGALRDEITKHLKSNIETKSNLIKNRL